MESAHGFIGFVVSSFKQKRIEMQTRHCLHSVANKKARISDALRG